MPKPRILVVDDDPLIVELIQTTLELEGYPVLSAGDGEEGLHTIRNEHPDLVISDVMMPKMDGFELVRRVRSDPLVGSTPLMMLSARGDEEDRIKGLDLGADDYMTKPFAPRELVARVGAMVRRLGMMTQRTAPPALGPFAEEGLERLQNFTFANFIVGRPNRSAQSAAKAVSEAPGGQFNPLVLYGGKGLGKTHLMCALANTVHDEDSGAKVLYVTSEILNQQIADAYRSGQEDNLADRYTQTDMLLVDDIQLLSISQGLQAVAAEVFSVMYGDGKQVVVSSDRSPNELLALSGEISSAFDAGLVAELGWPDAPLRIEILRFKAKEAGWPVETELLDYLARELDADVRTLEGAAKRLVAMKTLAGVRLDTSVVLDLVREIKGPDALLAFARPSARAPVTGSGGRRLTPRRPRVPARSSLLHPARRPMSREMREVKEAVVAPGLDNPLAEEFSRGLPVRRVVGLPDDVAREVPGAGGRAVVALGHSRVFVVDAIQAMVGGGTRQRLRLPRGERWAYMAHIREEPDWIVVGTNAWVEDSEMARALQSRESLVFVVVLDSKSPQIEKARDLVSSVPESQSAVVTVLVGVLIEERETLTEMLRRLFRVPERIPVAVGGTIDTPGSRAWVKLALDRCPGRPFSARDESV
jgi:DNA-binding response OmpR family regulator